MHALIVKPTRRAKRRRTRDDEMIEKKEKGLLGAKKTAINHSKPKAESILVQTFLFQCFINQNSSQKLELRKGV